VRLFCVALLVVVGLMITAARPSVSEASEPIPELEATREVLGDRRAPSHPTSQGPIVVRGTEGADSIRVSQGAGGGYVVSVNGETRHFTREEMSRLTIQGGSGSDSITVASDVGVGLRIEGGAGDDQITGGGGGDSLDGGPGNDILRGGDGNDQLAGGSGDDEMSGGRGNDDLAGGAGRDRLTGGQGRDRFFHQSDDRLTDDQKEDTATRVDLAAPLPAGSAGPRPGR
jgi:Ca2+-binding RTX toxin-like protein